MKTKTAQQILDSKNLHWTYYATEDKEQKRELHDCDCPFCLMEDRVLEAMEEYKNQGDE